MSLGISNNLIGDYEAQAHFAELLNKVEAGAEMTITKHGCPVARMVPVKKQVSTQNRRVAIDRIKKLSQGLKLNGLKIRDLIDEGRR
jgi:prevent-host-death family protein